jgi:hypothetical protein
MTGTKSVVTARIKKEIKTLEMLGKELEAMRERGTVNNDSERKRAFASLLHDFYTCIEKIFQTIAKNIDDFMPEGEQWHKALLEQMNLPLEDRRPQVISDKLVQALLDYLVFRHRVRNIYGFQLDWERMDSLINDMPDILQKVKEELEAFIRKVEEI